MKKRWIPVLLTALLLMLTACTAGTPAESSASSDPKSEQLSSEASAEPSSSGVSSADDASSEGNGLAGQVIGGSEPLYLGTLVYDTIEFSVDNAFDIKEHTEDYIGTGGGDVHMPSGATMKPGSSLKGNNMIQITELEDNAAVAFTYKTELTEEELTEALDRFMEENQLDDGTGLMDAVCYLYTDEFVCLLFPTDQIEGKEVWFCVRDEGAIILAPRE